MGKIRGRFLSLKEQSTVLATQDIRSPYPLPGLPFSLTGACACCRPGYCAHSSGETGPLTTPRQWDWTGRWNTERRGGQLRSDLIRGISAHHVQDRETASGVEGEPRVETQDIVLEDDDGVSVGNHGINDVRCQDLVAVHSGGARRSRSRHRDDRGDEDDEVDTCGDRRMCMKRKRSIEGLVGKGITGRRSGGRLEAGRMGERCSNADLLMMLTLLTVCQARSERRWHEEQLLDETGRDGLLRAGRPCHCWPGIRFLGKGNERDPWCGRRWFAAALLLGRGAGAVAGAGAGSYSGTCGWADGSDAHQTGKLRVFYPCGLDPMGPRSEMPLAFASGSFWLSHRVPGTRFPSLHRSFPTATGPGGACPPGARCANPTRHSVSPASRTVAQLGV